MQKYTFSKEKPYRTTFFKTKKKVFGIKGNKDRLITNNVCHTKIPTHRQY